MKLVKFKYILFSMVILMLFTKNNRNKIRENIIMDKSKQYYFKNKLLQEKNRILKLVEDMKRNEITDMYEEMADELSTFDNHPGDIASIRSDLERGAYQKENEHRMLRKIEDAIHSIEEGKYGRCANCGQSISEERLEVIPYARTCVGCKES